MVRFFLGEMSTGPRNLRVREIGKVAKRSVPISLHRNIERNDVLGAVGRNLESNRKSRCRRTLVDRFQKIVGHAAVPGDFAQPTGWQPVS